MLRFRAVRSHARGLRVAAVQLSVGADPVDNLRRAAKGLRIAGEEGASIAALAKAS